MAFPQYQSMTRSASAPRFAGSAAYGSNPYTDASRKIWELINRVTGGLRQTGSVGATGSTGASYGSLEPHVARPGDAEVGDYMSNVMAGQRNTLDEYVRRASGAGIGRDGRATAGSLPLGSALYDKAMKTLAGGYSDRFREAMDYNKYAKATRYRQSTDSLRNLQELLGMQHKYLSSQADWEGQLADRLAGERRSEQQVNLTQAERQLALDRLREMMEMERWRNYMEKQDRILGQKGRDDLEVKFRQLAEKMGMNQFDTGLPPGEQLWAERLGVDLGYLKPWQRSLSVRMGK